MNTLINHGILPGILNELMTSRLNFTVDKQYTNRNWPQIDILENDNCYLLKAEIPGLKKSDLNMVVEKGVLSIEGERKAEEKQEDGKYYFLERRHGKFSRSFSLPEGINADGIEAKLVNGLLEVAIPKAEVFKPKSIEIKIS